MLVAVGGSVVGAALMSPRGPTVRPLGDRRRELIVGSVARNFRDPPERVRFAPQSQVQTRVFGGRELTRIWEQTRNSVLFVTHDIHEAVALSDEVWVMSHRPSRIVETVVVDLGRPRPANLMANARYQELTAHLWELIKTEAGRSLAPDVASLETASLDPIP